MTKKTHDSRIRARTAGGKRFVRNVKKLASAYKFDKTLIKSS